MIFCRSLCFRFIQNFFEFLRFSVGAFLPLWGCRSEPGPSPRSPPIGVCSSEASGSSFPGSANQRPAQVGVAPLIGIRCLFLGQWYFLRVFSNFILPALGIAGPALGFTSPALKIIKALGSLLSLSEINVSLARSASGVCFSGNG